MDICPWNISPCDICPYQECLSCHWPDFHQTLKVGPWDNLEDIPFITVKFAKNFNNKKFCPKKISPKKIAKKCLPKRNFGKKFFLTKIYFAQKEILPPKNFANKKFVNKKKFFTENKIVEKNLPRKNFVTKIYCQKKILLNFFLQILFSRPKS